MQGIDRLKANRYAWKVFKATKEMKGVEKYIKILYGGVKTLVEHRFYLWDYMDELKRNNYIYCLENGIRFYLPYCKYFDTVQMCITRDEDFYEANNLRYLKKKYIKAGMNILDIGANIGNHSVFFAMECKAGHVFSFEPQKDVFKILKRNVNLNDLENLCSIYNVALGSSEGKAKIVAYNRNNCGGTVFAVDADGNIPLARLDEMELPEIGFIKIDVEGFEYDVLKGGEMLLRKMAPVLYIEIQDENFDRVNGLLNAFGYAMAERIYGDYLYKKILI